MSEKIRRFYRVEGRVQGVGYRWWAARKARAIGVSGTVRNRPDGSVEVLIEGPSDSVAKLARALLSGPPGARVDKIEELAPPDGTLTDRFEIVG